MYLGDTYDNDSQQLYLADTYDNDSQVFNI